jgi:hypothetical protein
VAALDLMKSIWPWLVEMVMLLMLGDSQSDLHPHWPKPATPAGRDGGGSPS